MAFGHQVSLGFRRLQPDTVTGLLDDAGFDIVAQLVRAPIPAGPAASIPRAFVIACKGPPATA